MSGDEEEEEEEGKYQTCLYFPADRATKIFIWNGRRKKSGVLKNYLFVCVSYEEEKEVVNPKSKWSSSSQEGDSVSELTNQREEGTYF